eukprot:CAMPEP_0170606148 /NCGR_PEP_ID=MMETSP0224-20130122/20351_1 /TAXON_ID=285029 /ORGANISM="Togula jolla, Strain CCCM 725" /LENGTH=340 /DNA_ID=CAMNT_0010931197 /DNA_START=6 /DNA_END=1025 /DNA_ORIENTATION=-
MSLPRNGSRCRIRVATTGLVALVVSLGCDRSSRASVAVGAPGLVPPAPLRATLVASHGAPLPRGFRSRSLALHCSERPFSRERLAAESEAPFAKVRIVLWGLGVVSTLTGFLFILPRLIGSTFGAPNAAPVESVLSDVAINFVGAVLFAFLLQTELATDAQREQQKEEGALISRLPVRLRDSDAEGSTVRAKLSEVRASRKQRARRPVLCVGDVDFCCGCLKTAAEAAETIDNADLLVVPVTLKAEDRDAAALAEASSGLSFVALPEAASPDWERFCRLEEGLAEAAKQDISGGCVVIVKKKAELALVSSERRTGLESLGKWVLAQELVLTPGMSEARGG